MKLKFNVGHFLMFMYAFAPLRDSGWDKIVEHMGRTWSNFDYLNMIPRNKEPLIQGHVNAWKTTLEFKKIG
jgi:hypothetical protein